MIELASDSDDEKRLFRAEQNAERVALKRKRREAARPSRDSSGSQHRPPQLTYQEVFFENGNSKVAARNNTILTLKETQKGIDTVKDLYCQIPVKSGRQLNRTAILKIQVY